MKVCKHIVCNNYKISIKLFPLLAMCLLLVCCVSNHTKQSLSSETPLEISSAAVNINNASAQELEKLPHVGQKTAERIIVFRTVNGKFRRPEHLLLVEGISDAHYREIRNLIKVE